MGHVDVAGVRYELPDGRVLLDDVSFRVGEGAKVALVGANGAGKTTLLRIITGELTPKAGAVTRTGGLGVMRQLVARGSTTVAEMLLSVSPPRVRAAAAEVDRLELKLMDVDDEATQMAYATALVRVRRRRRLRDRGRLGHLLHDGARGGLREGEVPRPRHPQRWRAEAAGAGVPPRRSRPGAAARRAGQLPRRTREDLARGPDPRVAQDDPVHQPRPRAAEQHRDPGGDRRARGGRQLGVDASGRVRVVPRGAARPVRALRGADPALGGGARQAQGAGADAEAEGDVQRRDGLALPRRPDAAAQVRGGRSADRAAAPAAGEHAAQGRSHRQARGRLRGPRADRADEAVRPRGLVRRAGRRARLQRLRASPTSCGCSRPAAATPTSSTGRWATPRSRP